MICKDCTALHRRDYSDNTYEYYCYGVKHPFVIKDINNECTEYVDDNMTAVPSWANLDLGCDTYKRPRLIVLCGVPGSGKSTYARNKVNNSDSNLVLSLTSNVALLNIKDGIGACGINFRYPINLL